MVCENCGGDESIHHYQTMQCPVGGREGQEYLNLIFKEAKPNSERPALELTKREHIAISAMQGMLSSPFELTYDEVVEAAYSIADKMLDYKPKPEIFETATKVVDEEQLQEQLEFAKKHQE